MIYLTFNNLDQETQRELLETAREHVESADGKWIKEYCRKHGADYDTTVDEETIKKLYTYDYVFNI